MFSGEVPGSSINSVILEISERSASGELVLKPRPEDGNWVKKVRFWQGMVCGTSSSLIDDRLGEILYRAGRMRLETFSDVAGQVSESTRFGTLLVEKKLYTPTQLWSVLCLQSRKVLESLCLYDRLTLNFQEKEDIPVGEFPLGESLESLLQRALSHARDVKRFDHSMRRVQEIQLHPLATSIDTDDYTSDLIQLIKEEPRYLAMLEAHTSVSREYVIESLFELFVQGVISNDLSIGRSELSDVSVGAIQNDLKWANGVVKGFHQAALLEKLDDWHAIIDSTRVRLREMFGPGLYISKESGFLADSFIRAIQHRDTFRNFVMQSPSTYLPDVLVRCFRQNLIDCLLYILFELYNRRPGSKEVRQIQLGFDAERVRWSL